mmetsp:Transcript_43524/g.52754  ORF Transcript_43524/g.52754 Transcript_43524/m.52754 type:complete len:99 (-) Transcript_43524:117-413(-)
MRKMIILRNTPQKVEISGYSGTKKKPISNKIPTATSKHELKHQEKTPSPPPSNHAPTTIPPRPPLPLLLLRWILLDLPSIISVLSLLLNHSLCTVYNT